MAKKNIRELKRDIAIKAKLRGFDLKFYSTWGLFSPEHIDEGSELLIHTITVRPHDTILDLGCGYGAIGLTMARLAPQGIVHSIDKDFVAVEYTKKNAKLNNIMNCEVYLSNAFDSVPSIRFDTIVSNLPAKVSKELFWIILEDAKTYLKPGGQLCVVTISGLKEFIKRNFKETFGNYKKLAQSKTYAVAMAIKG